MHRRPLGSTGLSIAPLVLGGNVFGWTVDEPTGFKILDAFVDAGFNAIDTADTYSTWVDGHVGGESESIIGRWIATRGRREEVVLATKVGMEMGSGEQGLSPEHIATSIEGSLRRLQTDRVDLYQSHTDDPNTPFVATLGSYDRLLRAGKIRAIGASNFSAERLGAALAAAREHGLPAYQTLQPRYNLLDRGDYEGAVEDVCRRSGLGVITYSSLASGFLSGKYRSSADAGKSPRGARGTSRLDARGRRILAALDEVAAGLDASPAAVAIAWLLTRPTVTAPIASATSVGQLEELIAGTTLRLDPSSLRLLTESGRERG
ncbi:MAG: aldo/keto reductase [Thermoplasmata archaeon]|nr:aldo/keto reductase [Thermoplasmata archaeon]